MHFKREAYLEFGAEVAGLAVSNLAQETLNLGASLQIEKIIMLSNGDCFQPDVHAVNKTNLLGRRKIFNKVSFIAGGN